MGGHWRSIISREKSYAMWSLKKFDSQLIDMCNWVWHPTRVRSLSESPFLVKGHVMIGQHERKHINSTIWNLSTLWISLLFVFNSGTLLLPSMCRGDTSLVLFVCESNSVSNFLVSSSFILKQGSKRTCWRWQVPEDNYAIARVKLLDEKLSE